jgi:hypothetical protein
VNFGENSGDARTSRMAHRAVIHIRLFGVRSLVRLQRTLKSARGINRTLERQIVSSPMLVFISGWAVDSRYGGLVQAKIYSELSAVVCHMAKERLIQGYVSRGVEQNPRSHNETPRPLEVLVRCSLKGLTRLSETVVERTEQLNSVFENFRLERLSL